MVSYKTNLILDVLLLIVFVVCALSGFFMRIFGRETHFISGVVLVLLVVLHLIFHWGQIWNFFFGP